MSGRLFLCAVLVAATSVFSTRAQISLPPPPPSPIDALAPRREAGRVYPLKARFSPGESVQIGVQAVSPTDSAFAGPLELRIFHLQDEVYRATSEAVTLLPDAPTTMQFAWTPPATDFTGYLAVVSAGQHVLGSTGIDVSSSPLGYPRYGYLSNFSPDLKPEVLEPIVATLSQDYHLNMFQFYDWFWRHEQLIERDNGNIPATWQDLFGRTNSVQVIHDLIETVHRYNALALAYVMIYAAREGYAERTPIQPSWGMFGQPDAKAQLSFDFGALRPGTTLFLFDPANPDWQAWMASQYADAMQTFSFDGVHIDQLGPRFDVLHADGTPLDLPRTFPIFLEAIRARLTASDPRHAACTFNLVDGTVDGFAVADVAKSPACDFLYSEIWFKTNTYADLRRYIEQLREMGRGRPVVLAAYAQYGEQVGPAYEAEGETTLAGAGIAGNVAGFTGFGFVDSMDNAGDSITWTIDAPEASPESLVFRYANASGQAVKGAVYVNDARIGELQFPSWGEWSAWQLSFHVEASFNAGKNTVRLAIETDTDGAILVDNLRLSQFDEEAVRLQLAGIFASGATPIIIGDDQQSLGQEYYPDRSKAIPPPLKRALRDDLSFISAYETLLFPPEVTSLGNATARLVTLSNARLIDSGANGIWVVPRRIGPYDIFHLINLVGVDDQWRNASEAPQAQKDIRLRYYIGDAAIDGVYLASPDFDSGRTMALDYMNGEDARGRYVELTVPRLLYWDMVYLVRHTG
jgi:glycosyl hydrolase family 66/carbohydrate binding protein with CBM35 domain